MEKDLTASIFLPFSVVPRDEQIYIFFQFFQNYFTTSLKRPSDGDEAVFNSLTSATSPSNDTLTPAANENVNEMKHIVITLLVTVGFGCCSWSYISQSC